MTRLDVLLGVAEFAVVAAASTLSFQLAKHPAADRPTLGARGLNRARCLNRSAVFAVLEPPMRVLAAWVSLVPPGRARTRLHLSLVHSGQYLGLSEEELVAASALVATGLGLPVWLLCELLDEPRALAACATCLGAAAPWFRVHSVAQARARSVNRALPGAVDLAAMCMSGGLDFPGALRQIVDSASDPNEPLIEEFSRVLQELDLGHTRRRAMAGFASRIPTEQVREFVNSVIQAEDKGSPLASVLSIQSQTQRLRRSVEAEESASDAALMLLGPMTLIFLCVIVLLLGPVVVRFMTGGLGPA